MKQKDYLVIVFGVLICFIFAVLIILAIVLALTYTTSSQEPTDTDFKSNGNQIRPEPVKNNPTSITPILPPSIKKIDSQKSSENTDVTPISLDSVSNVHSERQIRRYKRSFPRRKRNYHCSVESCSDFSDFSDTDSEINSVGETEDLPFDIRSPVSECSVRLPYSEKSGKVFCKKEVISTGSNCIIIDVCSYSDMTIFLMDNGKFIIERGSHRTKIESNIVLSKICPFQGYLYGITDSGELYKLKDSESKTWIWSKIKWSVDSIIDINSTFDGSKLWIQTEENAYLYSDENSTERIEFSKHKRRVYGRNHHHYVDIDMKKLSAKTSDGRLYRDISYAALNYYDEVVTIPIDEKHKYKSIVIVDWKPYYLATL